MATQHTELTVLLQQDKPDTSAGTELAFVDMGQSSADQNPAVAYLQGLRSHKSRVAMFGVLNRLARQFNYPDLYACDWAMMRRHHVQTILTALQKRGLAPNTINTCLAALKGVAAEAWIIGRLSVDEYQHIKRIKGLKSYRVPKGRSLSQHEVTALIEVCCRDSSATGVRDAAMFGILLGCGLRRAEVVGLDIESYLRQESGLVVLGKGNKERIAFMPDDVEALLQAWLDQHPCESGPLFTRIRRHETLTTDRLTEEAVRHRLKVRSEEAFFTEKASPHDLRRTYATTLLDNGEDLLTVKDAMGHSSVTTTQKYDKRGEERLRQASKRLKVT